MRLLAFDFGFRRIGVATGQTITGTAQPETTLQMPDRQLPWSQLDDLIRQWRPDALVVGIPYHMDGKPHELTEACQAFAVELQQRAGLPVHRVDERLTSNDAEAAYRAQRQQGRKRADKTAIDALAAKIILESWLREQGYV